MFLSTRTGSGKSLTYECFPLVYPNTCVLVIAPLINIMTEQCTKLTKLGFKATYIGRDSVENTEIERGSYDFVYGSPEMLLASNKWREMLKSTIYQEKLKLIAVDEAHTVLQWYIYELFI